MAIVRREQVFVSSTFTDLKEERQEVMQTLLEAGCIPAGMELFPASDSEKLTLIQRVIAECDYYIVVIGGRYGSIDPERDLGYTELEFDYAESIGLPIMGFIHGDPASLAVKDSDVEPDLRQRLDAFKDKVQVRMVKYWTTPKDLGGQVAKSLIQIRNERPAEGWIRARDALTPEITAELAFLRSRVAELSAELRLSQSTSAGAPALDLAGGDDEYVMDYRLVYTVPIDKSTNPYGTKTNGKWLTTTVTWDDLFFVLGPMMLDEATEKDMDERLDRLARTAWLREAPDKPTDFVKLQSVQCSSDTIADVIVQFLGLALIERSADRKRGVADSDKYWRLTPKGREHLINLRAFRSSDRSAPAESAASDAPAESAEASTQKAARTKPRPSKQRSTKSAARGATRNA